MGSTSASMRFCMVTTFYPPHSFGGDALFVQRLSRELAARGHRVDVVHGTDAYRLLGGAEPAEVAPEPPGITVHALASRAGFLWPLAMQQTGGRPSPHAGCGPSWKAISTSSTSTTCRSSGAPAC